MQSPNSLKRLVSAKPCLSSPLLLLLLVLLRLGIRTVLAEDTSNVNFYTAGVVEFRPTILGMSSSDLVLEHLRAYLDIIESPEAGDTDIIVFPEGTLNNALQLTYVPAEKDKIVPCLANDSKLYADFLVELSCAARRVHRYLVINLSEQEECSAVPLDPRPCANNGLNVYNTNVVFDREGRVVSRYRKVNVYVENKNTTLKPEYGIFDTDFGVRFGHFICFDILFYTPAQELVQQHGITDFIFTSLFYSELPFLTATQLQQGWAWGNNVNLLAAGASYPQSGTTGTGIYSGNQGSLISVMVKGEGERRLYKAQVHKIGTEQAKKPPPPKSAALREPTPNRSHLNGIRLMKDPQIQNYNSVLLDVTRSTNSLVHLCHNQLCCDFSVAADVSDSTNISSHYRYRLGVFDGRRSYEKDERSDIKVCAVYACAGEDTDSCGEVLQTEHFHWPVLFKNMHIRGSFPKSQKLLIMPTTLDDELNPLPKDFVQWNQVETGSSYDVDISLSEEHGNIMTFGIYATYYEKSAAPAVATAQILGFTVVGCVVLIELLKVLINFK